MSYSPGQLSDIQCIFNHHIELDEDGVHARGEIYNVSYLLQVDADILYTWHGRYLDRYEKRHGDFDRPSPGRVIGP